MNAAFVVGLILPLLYADHCCSICGRPGIGQCYMLTIVAAFVAGLVISTVWFLFMWYSLDYSAWATLITCSIISVLLSLGMAYVQFIRCMVLLILPQICSGDYIIILG